MAFIRCYLDGSEDHDAKTFGVGGFVGEADNWETLESAWLAELPESVEYFHATDCFGGHGQFKGIDIPERIKLLDKLTDLVIAFRQSHSVRREIPRPAGENAGLRNDAPRPEGKKQGSSTCQHRSE